MASEKRTAGRERGRESLLVSFARLLYSIAEYNVGKRSLHHFGGSQKPIKAFKLHLLQDQRE
jgi:hypothetical protein